MTRGPDFFIIGAMKAATSTLHVQLSGQPGVFMSEPKEPCFFSDDAVYARGVSWYHTLFDDAAADDIRGESSTHYTKLPTHPHTIERMQEHLRGEERFIYVIRHPIDRLISHYVHEWTQRVIACPIDEAIDTHRELIAYSRPAMQLQPYIEAFGHHRILLVFFDALSAQPQVAIERVGRFIGMSATPQWRDDEGQQNVSRERLRKSAWRDALLNMPGATALRRRLVPRSWRDRLKRRWMMKDRPELSESRTRSLQAIFDDDLRTLGAWIGVELTCRSFHSVAREHTPSWADAAAETSP